MCKLHIYVKNTRITSISNILTRSGVRHPRIKNTRITSISSWLEVLRVIGDNR